MSRTARTTPLLRPFPFRVAVGGAAAVVVLAACGGGSSDADSATASAAEQGEEAAPPDGVAEFCAQAAELDERVDAALSDLDGDDASVVDGFRSLAQELRGIEAPAAIASDWSAMAAGLDRLADAFSQVDFTDLGSLEALEQAEGGMTEPGKRVDAYLSEECGI